MTRAWQRDEGSAIVEFVVTVCLLLLPVVYLAEAGARQGAVVVAGARNDELARERLAATVDLALKDQGLPASWSRTKVSCSKTPCQRPGSHVNVQVRVSVRLPGAPQFMEGRVPTTVTVSARGEATSDRFRSG